MAESADAGGLNPPDGNILRVQVPLRAPTVLQLPNSYRSGFLKSSEIPASEPIVAVESAGKKIFVA